jgi:ribosomal protein S9
MFVNEGGMSCIAKAARYAISKSLCSFLNETDIAKMRLGLFY